MTSSLNVSLTAKLLQEAPGQRRIDPSRLGDLAEKWVSLLASYKGAEVFPNLNSTGPSDLIMVLDGVTYLMDVKLARPNGSGSWKGDTGRVKDPVIPVLVIPTGDITEWKVQWIRNRYPEELKNFWHKAPTALTHVSN